MDIGQMHVWFRQYAQQMGMQNVRAILPEQIDVVINTSITDTVNQLIRENVGVTNDRIITDNSKIGQINALQPLYKVKELGCFGDTITQTVTVNLPEVPDDDSADITVGYSVPDDNPEENIVTVSGTSTKNSIQIDMVRYNNAIGFDIGITVKPSSLTFTKDSESGWTLTFDVTAGRDCNVLCSYSSYARVENGTFEIARRFKFDTESVNTGLIKATNILTNYMFLIDFSLNYINSSRGLQKDYYRAIASTNSDDEFISNYFPVRLIDDAYLSDTINDFVLKNRLRSPILTIFGDNYHLYIDKFTKTTNGYYLPNSLVPYKLRVSYLSKPAVVSYAEDTNGTNVDCDLPDYMHVDILKHAVDLYRTAVNGSLYSAQQQNEQNRQEISRNNARPDNEGYQS